MSAGAAALRWLVHVGSPHLVDCRQDDGAEPAAAEPPGEGPGPADAGEQPSTAGQDPEEAEDGLEDLESLLWNAACQVPGRLLQAAVCLHAELLER